MGTPTDASAAMAAHRPLSSAMRSNDDIDWPVHFLMVSFHCMMIFEHTEPASDVISSVIEEAVGRDF